VLVATFCNLTLHRGGMKRISLKGVAIGNIADIVSSNIIGLLLAAYILISSAPSGLADGSATQVLMASSFYRVSVIILGALCSVMGGYVSARIAKRDDVLNGALSSALCVGFGVYALLSGSAAGHLGLHLALLPVSVALGALGGYLSSRRRAQHP
jgi:hypothetical protein